MLLGIKKREITKMFVLENFILGFFSLLLSVPVGFLLSQFISLMVVRIFGIPDVVFIRFDILSVGVLLIYFAVIYVLVLLNMLRKMRKMTVHNFLYLDILSQIIQNSVKYFDKEEKHLTIYSRNQANQILLVMEDNGCGIKESEISRVFEKGFTGSNRKKANATGMGLYLAKKLCGRLGLGLEMDSRENQYTKLTVIFPKGSVHLLSD